MFESQGQRVLPRLPKANGLGFSNVAFEIAALICWMAFEASSKDESIL